MTVTQLEPRASQAGGTQAGSRAEDRQGQGAAALPCCEVEVAGSISPLTGPFPGTRESGDALRAAWPLIWDAVTIGKAVQC